MSVADSVPKWAADLLDSRDASWRERYESHAPTASGEGLEVCLTDSVPYMWRDGRISWQPGHVDGKPTACRTALEYLARDLEGEAACAGDPTYRRGLATAALLARSHAAWYPDVSAIQLSAPAEPTPKEGTP